MDASRLAIACIIFISLMTQFPRMGAAAVVTSPAVLRSQFTWYLKPGRVVSLKGARLSLYCHGHGRPTVVFDSGIEESAAEWVMVQPGISRLTRTCAYDRAGYGFSNAGPFPRMLDRLVGELHALLIQAGERDPFLLVGHSFGGVIARSFARRFPAQVAGIVLDDSENEEFNFALAPPAGVDAYISSEQEALSKCAQLAKVLWRGAAREKQECLGQMFRGLPEKRFSPQLNQVLISQALRPLPYEAASSELSNFTVSGLRASLSERQFLGCIPIYVLTAGHHAGLPAALEERWQLFARDFLAMSTDARQVFVGDSGHAIELDEPNVVIDAIKKEIAMIRRRGSGASPNCTRAQAQGTDRAGGH